MTTDFRALCAELLAALESWSPNGGAPLEEGAEVIAEAHLINRARAALAEPEPAGPTKAELKQLFDDHSGYINDEQVMWWSDFHAAARAILARWGNHPGSPDGSPPLAAELIAVVEAIQADPDDCKDYEANYRTGWIDACNQVLELLHRRRTGASGSCSELGQ